MIGKIVEIHKEDGLFIVVDYKNNEDAGSCSYDRYYWVYPYDSGYADELDIRLSATRKVHESGISRMVNIREDKMPYTPYGYSVIRGVKTVMLERKWEEVVMPRR